MKIIKNWLFINHIWQDAEPSPIAININNICQITEECNSALGTHVVIHTNDHNSNPVEGDIVDILALLQNHLSNN